MFKWNLTAFVWVALSFSANFLMAQKQAEGLEQPDKVLSVPELSDVPHVKQEYQRGQKNRAIQLFQDPRTEAEFTLYTLRLDDPAKATPEEVKNAAKESIVDTVRRTRMEKELREVIAGKISPDVRVGSSVIMALEIPILMEFKQRYVPNGGYQETTRPYSADDQDRLRKVMFSGASAIYFEARLEDFVGYYKTQRANDLGYGFLIDGKGVSDEKYSDDVIQPQLDALLAGETPVVEDGQDRLEMDAGWNLTVNQIQNKKRARFNISFFDITKSESRPVTIAQRNVLHWMFMHHAYQVLINRKTKPAEFKGLKMENLKPATHGIRVDRREKTVVLPPTVEAYAKTPKMREFPILLEQIKNSHRTFGEKLIAAQSQIRVKEEPVYGFKNDQDWAGKIKDVQAAKEDALYKEFLQYVPAKHQIKIAALSFNDVETPSIERAYAFLVTYLQAFDGIDEAVADTFVNKLKMRFNYNKQAVVPPAVMDQLLRELTENEELKASRIYLLDIMSKRKELADEAASQSDPKLREEFLALGNGMTAAVRSSRDEKVRLRFRLVTGSDPLGPIDADIPADADEKAVAQGRRLLQQLSSGAASPAELARRIQLSQAANDLIKRGKITEDVLREIEFPKPAPVAPVAPVENSNPVPEKPNTNGNAGAGNNSNPKK